HSISILAAAREINEELYRNISEIHFEEHQDPIFYTAEFGIPVVIGREQVGINLVKFESFWKSVVAKSGAQQLQYIDLRFEDQVVVRWNHAPA
ncbi:MAG: cell division protein FtsQ/DivIB, partial [bacterium]